MGPEAPKPIDEKTLRVLKVFNRIDDAVSRASFPILRWLAKKRGVEMYKVSTFGEQQALVRRLGPLLTNAIDIRIVEGDLSEGLLSEREWPPDTRIRITQVPEGSAPEKVRRSWLGTEMDAYKLSSSSGELDLATGEPSTTQRQTEDIYAVKLKEALQSLEGNSSQAAEWFRSNLAPNIDALSFGGDEVTILQ